MVAAMNIWHLCRQGLARLSLRQVVVLGLGLGIVLPALVVGPWLARDSYQRVLNLRVHTMLTQYGDMLEHSMVTPVWHVDQQAALVLLNSMLLNPDVVAVRVDDARLGKFVHVAQESRRQGQIVSETRQLRHQDRVIGRVTIEMSTAQVEQQFQRNLWKVGLALLLQLLISFALVFVLFERRLMKPLRHLRASAQHLAQNEFSQPIIPLQNDELGELALALDAMREKLCSHIEQIREFNANLEHMVSSRTEELHQANRELQATLQTLENAQREIERSERMAALGALVAGVAHELNTPIGNCVTVASTLNDLQQQFAESAQAGIKRSALNQFLQQTASATDILLRNLTNAAELIGSFKRVAVDRTSAKRRRFDLDEVVAETVRTINPGIKKSGHRIEQDIAPNLVFDSYPGPLGQILSNLINNAILHGFEGRENGRILIHAHAVSDDEVCLTVEDNGIGIPESHLEKIFEPFFTTKHGRGGSGLGLNIVFNLVRDVLGGRVEVSSEAGKGTCFTLHLRTCAPQGNPVSGA